MEKWNQAMNQFLTRFTQAAEQYDGTTQHAHALQLTIDDYAHFIINADHQKLWLGLSTEKLEVLQPLVAQLQDTSARCVSIMEKYCAHRLLLGETEHQDYFQNIETSIEREFGAFTVTSASKVLLIGSGAFPMTPLLIAKRTNAQVTGIDIDREAVELGKRVIENLGPSLAIRLMHLSLEQMQGIGEMTHIIISSTVPIKYKLLDWLYAKAHPEVIVAIRYGDHLKSIFNYPMEQVDADKWMLADTTVQPEHVFDVALYRKVLAPVPGRREFR